MSPDPHTEVTGFALPPLAGRPSSLTTRVFAEIRDKIVDATLPPGSRVSESVLADQLRVSKTPVREALLRLRHIGLVEPSSTGLRVIQPSAKAIRDAYEFRAGVEAIAALHPLARFVLVLPGKALLGTRRIAHLAHVLAVEMIRAVALLRAGPPAMVASPADPVAVDSDAQALEFLMANFALE